MNLHSTLLTDTALSHHKAFLGPNSVVTTFCILQDNMKDTIYYLMTDLGKTSRQGFHLTRSIQHVECRHNPLPSITINKHFYGSKTAHQTRTHEPMKKMCITNCHLS